MRALTPIDVAGKRIQTLACEVLIIGSGASALATAERLSALSASAAETTPEAGQSDGVRIVIATEKLLDSTSYLSGSDKQTYYRLSLSGEEGDSVYSMADSLWSGGSMHGDIALAESAGSMEAFFSLVSIGVPFPQDSLGNFVGYKTDHDPRQRGTSLGPYTSRVMVERLAAEVRRRGDILVRENLQAVSLIVSKERKACGAIFLDMGVASAGVADGSAGGAGGVGTDDAGDDGDSFSLVAIIADHTVFGVGGPAGLYESSVYPSSQYGSIGLAIERGAPCVNLTESQFGIASVKVRWNLSGTYQQAIPRYYSVGDDGIEHDFLSPVFKTSGARDSAVFLKGYQWPFDPRKVGNLGSSLIDLLVHRERQLFSRSVFMDFRRNPQEWDPGALSDEASTYLTNSGALMKSGNVEDSPLGRLLEMNPPAYRHFLDHGIDLSREPLEITVAAQHNNGGLEADLWWESTEIRNFYPVGEVNGSHGVYRPGGSALNAGQVGAIRAARKINAAKGTGLSTSEWLPAAREAGSALIGLIEAALRKGSAGCSSQACTGIFRKRMDAGGGILRSRSEARRFAREALNQFLEFHQVGIDDPAEIPGLLKARHLVLAHAAYLDAVSAYIEHGGGSRGSYLVACETGEPLNAEFDASWRSLPENPALRAEIQRTKFDGQRFQTEWTARRPVPRNLDSWFENIWRTWREGRTCEVRSIPSMPE